MTRKHSARSGRHTRHSRRGLVGVYRLYERERGVVLASAGLFGVLRAVWGFAR